MDHMVKTSFNWMKSVREMLRWLAKRHNRSMNKHMAWMIIRDYREEYGNEQKEE